ncbi:PilT/PilU family type 4a pilus ATPase [Pseudomonadota bacterium]|nr:PilT/PilU family type 4a pilus ATPase [Pseudomonadota bacterium]
MQILDYLNRIIELKGSDLFLSAGSKPRIKVEGKLEEVGDNFLSSEILEAMAKEVMSNSGWEKFNKELELDFSINKEDLDSRFRVNVFRQCGNIALVLRRVPKEIPSLEVLKSPPILSQLIMKKRGLILMVGGTGSGKSTTLAAMIRHRNFHSMGHILTIEDPIEFVHEDESCLVNQREIGIDSLTYAAALRAAMRESPDVVMIGEIRDLVTMEAVLELCNTGHLVVSTLHSNNANQALDRIVNLFARENRDQVLMDLSLNLQGIISQRLVMGVDEARVAAMEILMMTPHIRELVLSGQLTEIKAAMEGSAQAGMQTFDSSLFRLYTGNFIGLDTALDNADSRTDLESKINFG